jgi:GGDEF domain-containing protein
MTFSHDGLRDSLTHLAAPPYFYENLRRELATAERNKSRLTLIKFILVQTPTSTSTSTSTSTLTPSESHYESAILSFAELLKASIRSEDLCARLGRMEFTLILKSSVEVGISLAGRVLGSWEVKDFSPLYSTLGVRTNESPLEILNRLDTQELHSITSR